LLASFFQLWVRGVSHFNVGELGGVNMKELEGIVSNAMYKCVEVGLWSGPNFDYESVAEWAISEIANALRRAGLGEAVVSRVVEGIKDKVYQEAYNCALDGYFSGNGAVDCGHAVKDVMSAVKSAISEAIKAQSANPRLRV